MPSSSVEYTLVGFSEQLDWRPLHFAQPLPPKRICSACGLVRKTTALLRCSHTLCESCFEQCAEEGAPICPLDGEHFEQDVIDWRDFAAVKVLERKVKCWNAKHGCGTVVAASLLYEHFQRECRHHSARCPKCSASVLCIDVCAHLRSDCATPSTPPARESGQQLNNTEDAPPSTSFQRLIDEQSAEVRTHLEQLVTDVQCHGDRLNEMSSWIKALRNRLTKKLTRVAGHIQDDVKRGVRELAWDNEELKENIITLNDNLSSNLGTLEAKIKDELTAAVGQNYDNCSQILASIHEMKEGTLDRIKTLLEWSPPRGAHVIFDINIVRSLEEQALKQGWATYESDQVCLCGYWMSPGVQFMKDSGSVHLYVRMLLHKGDNDDVPLPFMHKIRMGVLNPRDNLAQRFVEIKPSREYCSIEKPTTLSYRTCFFSCPSFNLDYLRADGSVSADTLRIKWEVLP